MVISEDIDLKYKNIILIITASVLVGCAANVPLSIDSVNKFKGKNLAIYNSDKPEFAAITADRIRYPEVSIRAGNKIIEENGVEDPAGYISQKLANDFSTKYGVNIINRIQVILPEDDVNKISEQYKEADYLFDIRTINWSSIYFPLDQKHYRVIYSVKLRFIDTSTKEVIAEGFCSRLPEKTDDAPNYDQLFGNKALRLKKELRIAADQCINEFRSNILKIE